MAKDKWNKKVNEKDYVRLAIIVGVLVLAYFIYVNFIPKNYNSTLKIDIIEISVSDCVDCVDLSAVSAGFVELGVEIDDYDVYASDSDEGREMIDRYSIEKVPTLVVVSKNVDELGIEGAFDIKKNYAVFDMSVPYLDISSGEIRGMVNLIEVRPECVSCLSLMPLRAQFEQLGVKVNDYEIVGAESVQGLEMIEKYDLEFAPALLISKDIDEYDWILSNVGEVLEDKGEYYLFKSAVAPYKDLVNGDVKGLVDITLVVDSSCEKCFDVDELKQSFLSMNVYFNSETVLDVSDIEGRQFARKYNVTSVPTVVLSKEILDYPQLREILGGVGTFNEDDQSFVFRKLEAVGEFVEVDL